MNKTIVIWDTVDANIKFFVVEDQDISHLDNKYVNSGDASFEETDTIMDLVYDSTGKVKVHLLDTFPVDEVTPDTKVIVCGFILTLN